MKLEGFQFQPLKESEAMFDVEEAPAWKEDSECSTCFRCRAEFTTMRRRHHCRACGQIFCHSCSSKTSPIPKFGIEKEVRVCDTCFDKINRNTSTSNPPGGSSSNSEDQLPIEYLNSPLFKEAKLQQTQAQKKPAEKSEQEFQDEINLALAISQSEAEAQEVAKRRQKSSSTSKSSSSLKSNKIQQQDTFSTNISTASAPYAENIVTNGSSQKSNTSSQSLNMNENLTQNDEEIRINIEIDEFVEELKKLLELYINRMKSDSMRGRSITNDTAVQSLFLQLQHLHPKLLSYIKYQEDARGYYETLQDKLTQLKDAREALNALRMENFEKKRREMEERERLRQLQISQKLQFMRQQKQSYYLYQNQLNLQHLQEQERDLQMRLNQQRELVFKRDQMFSNPGLGFKHNSSADSFMIAQQDASQMINSVLMQKQQYQNPQSGYSNYLNPQNYNLTSVIDPNLKNNVSSNLENQFQSIQSQQQNLTQQNLISQSNINGTTTIPNVGMIQYQQWPTQQPQNILNNVPVQQLSQQNQQHSIQNNVPDQISYQEKASEAQLISFD
jgi:growth factor-regulated tyrosine kinase substrate